MSENKDLMKKALLEIQRLKKLLSEKTISNEPTAIIGMACRLPNGIKNTQDFWQSLESGQDDIINVPENRWNEYDKDELLKNPYLQKAGFLTEDIEEFDSRLFKIPPKEASYIDPQQRMVLKVCWEVLENAGYSPTELKGKKIGVFCGVAQTDFLNENITRDEHDIDVTGMNVSFISGRISYFFGFHGPALTIDTACSASASAINQAIKSLRDNDCEMAIVCGVNIMFSPETTKKLSALNILSKTCELKSFDKFANGTVRGEGCCAILLKNLSKATADNDSIHCVIKGSYINHDGASTSLTAPNGFAQEELLKSAWIKSGITPNDIDYIETHGTGTALGDPIEIKSISNVIGSNRTEPLYIGSLKASIGHLEPASGIASVIKTALMLEHKKIVKSINYDVPSEYVNWNAIPVKVAQNLMDWNKLNGKNRVAGVSSFGLSGTNVHIVLEEYNKDTVTTQDMPVYPFMFSAVTENALIEQMKKFLAYVETCKDINLTNLSYTQNVTKAILEVRTLIMAKNLDDLKNLLNKAISGQMDSNIFTQKGLSKKKIVFTFTGQGSQYNNMCKDFYKNPYFKQAFDMCDKYYNQLTGGSLIDLVFSEKYDLSQTVYTQPAIFSVEYSLAYMYQKYGINPSIVFGHSIGEYVSACISGVFSLEDAMKLVVTRGKSIQEKAMFGKMMAIFTDKECIKDIIKPYNDVYISLSNSQQQTVIAGSEKSILEIDGVLNAKDIKHTILNTTRPFHTPFMQDASNDFFEVAKTVTYSKPKLNIISNVTSKAETTLFTTADYWKQHIVSEVRFLDSVLNLGNLSEYLFLEVGAMPILSGLIGRISNGNADCIYSASKDTSADYKIAEILSSMFLYAIPFDMRGYYKSFNAQICDIPNYAFDTKKIPYVHSLHEKVGYATPVINEVEETSNSSLELTDEKILEYIVNLLVYHLGIDKSDVDENTNLLTLGLSSLNGVKIVGDIKKHFNVEINLNDFFNNCTVSGWKELLKGLTVSNSADKQVNQVTIDEQHRYDMFDLNDIQYAYWAGRDNKNMLLSNNACCTYFELDMPNLDIEKFKHTLKCLEQRHDMLRCRMNKDAKQYIVKDEYSTVVVYDYKSISDMQKHLDNIRTTMSYEILPIDKPMFKVAITKLDDINYRIHFSIDFMIADAMSLYIFWKDMGKLYNGEILEPLTITYKDYLNYLNNSSDIKAKHDVDKKYWLSKIEDFPKSPELPFKSSEFVDNKHKFVRRRKNINPEQWKKFTQNCAKYGLTPSSALFTLYAEVLSAFGGGSSFAIMMTVFNRENINKDVQKIIGDFTKLALMDVHRKDTTVSKNALDIQSNIMNSISHTEYSATEFVGELRKHFNEDRMYTVVFTSAIGIDDLNKDILDNDAIFLKSSNSLISSTPQVCIDHQIFYEDKDIVLSWDTLDGVFMDNVVSAMFDVYTSLVDKAIENPEFFNQTLIDLRPSYQVEAHDKANMTTIEYTPVTLLTGFNKNVLENPNNVAVVTNGNSYTYKQLDECSNKVANQLIQDGVTIGDRVLVELPKSFEQIYSIVGILKAGAVYVPITYKQPKNRTINIIEKSTPKAIIGDNKFNDMGITYYSIIDFESSSNDGTNLPTISASDGAYIIYTSGSTGNPKGVYIAHGSAMNTIDDVTRKYNITSNDSTIAISSLSFDLSVYDVFGMLSVGGKIVIPTEQERIDPKSQYQLVKQNDVTVWNTVPAIMDLYLDFLNKKSLTSESIRKVILSGDWIPLNLLDKLYKALPNAELTSMGGATEASIWSNYFNVDTLNPEWNSIPYGYPLANQRFYILDDFNRRCPDYVSGKLHIAGDGLAECYYNEPSLTENAFYVHKSIGERLYNTGDYGKYIGDGVIEFLGRKDGQIKINGYRIEIGEIISAIKKCGIDSKAIIMPVGNSRKKIVAFLIQKDTIDQELLKQELGKYLPKYFIPDKIICIEDLPVTANDKSDMKKLHQIYEDIKNSSKASNTSNENVNPILKKIREILDISEITENDSFSAFGVSSVDMIRLADELESIYGERPSISDMISYKSVSELINFFDGKVANDNNNFVQQQDNSQPDDDDNFVYTTTELQENPLEKYSNQGIELYLEDGKLKFKASKGKMTPQLKAELIANKQSLIEYLTVKAEQEKHDAEYFKENSFLLTPLQKAYLLGRSNYYELGGTSAHYYTEIEWNNLDLVKLEKSINKVIRYNDILQTVVFSNGTQAVLENMPYYKVKVGKVSNEELLQVRSTWSEHKYEIGKWPMFDIIVSDLGNDNYIVHFSFDCILLDGWSANMMISEIFEVYEGRTIKKPQLSFKDYVTNESIFLEDKEYHKKAIEYWENSVQSLPNAPELKYKVDFSQVETPHFKRKRFVLDKNKTHLLNEKIKKYGLTASAVICTAYMSVLSKYSNTHDFTLNLTLFNRLPLHNDVWNILGDFTNITLIPYFESKNSTFMDSLTSTKNYLVEAIEHRTYNGLELLKHFSDDNILKAVMPVVFTSMIFGNLESSSNENDIFDSVKEVYSISQTPQVSLDHQALVRNNELVLIWDYVSELFDAEIIDNMFNDYINFINTIANSDNWEIL